MFAHKSVPHLSSQCALAHMAKTLSFHSIAMQWRIFYIMQIVHILSVVTLIVVAPRVDSLMVFHLKRRYDTQHDI
jgi:hypothetical protein